MKYAKSKRDPEITVCLAQSGNTQKAPTGYVWGIIGQVGHLLDNDIILTDDDTKRVNRAAWIFVDRASGYCSPELPTKEAVKEYAERIYG